MKARRLLTVPAGEVAPQTARFAWAGRIPLGAVSVLAGPPGQGKTQLMLGACARATRGKLDGDLGGLPATVLYVSAEDSIEHTLTPRAIAAGADLSRLHFFQAIATDSHRGDEERPGFLVPEDLPLLDSWLEEQDARIVVLDPIVAMIPVSLNTHRDQHVRRALAPLARIANERAVAVVAVMHLNKNQEADALSRLSGSIGFGGAARSVLLFAGDPDDPDGENGSRRILAHVKCNVAPRQPSIAYRIEPRTLSTANGPVETSVAVRDGDAKVSANDLLDKPTSASEASARSDARDFLFIELANGPVPTTELKARADDAGLNWRTVERAKRQLSIRARKTGTAWAWEMTQPTPSPNTPPVGLVGLVGDEGRKADKADNSATKEDVAALDAEAELERITSKFGMPGAKRAPVVGSAAQGSRQSARDDGEVAG